jgi:HNH endonuclease
LRGFLRFLVGLIVVVFILWLILFLSVNWTSLGESLSKSFNENEIGKFILEYWFFIGGFLCSIFIFVFAFVRYKIIKKEEILLCIILSLGFGFSWFFALIFWLAFGIVGIHLFFPLFFRLLPFGLVWVVDWVIFTKLFPERENKELIINSSDNKDKKVLSSVKNSSSNKANANYSSVKQETEIYKPIEKVLKYGNPVVRALISGSQAELLEENEQKIVLKIPKERKSFFDQLNKEEKKESIKKILNKEIEFILSETPQLTEQSKQKEVVSLRRERNPEFPKIVKQAYDYSCAVCKKRIFDLQGNPEVEAAHIYPKALDGVDDIRNGLALCKSHHWAFDQGLFSISDEYQILVNQKIVNEENYFEEIGKYNRKIINLPENYSLRPHSIFLTEHRRIHGFT